MKYKGIGLVGKAWAGKTTVAGMLADYGFVRCSFARPIKIIIQELWNIDQKDRKLLQRVGLAMREIDPNVWVRRCIKDVRHFTKRNIMVVIDDVRFENEAAALRREKFLFVRIVRPGVHDPAAGDHISETEQDAIQADFTLTNVEGLAELLQMVKTVMAQCG